MIKKQGKPITGNPMRYRPIKPLLSNQTQTSLQAEQRTRRGPSKLVNSKNETNTPAPANRNYRAGKGAEFARATVPQFTTNSVNEPHTVPFANVGYASGPYQSQRGIHSVNSGHPTRAKREAGPGSFPKAIKPRVTGKLTTNLDIFSPRVLHESGLTRL
jgi:hypothetical protein